MCSVDDATVSTTDWKRFGELDRVNDIEDVEGAVERGGAVQVPEERGRVGREGRGAEEVHGVIVEVLCIVGRRAGYRGRSDSRICCFGGKEDGMGKLDLLLRRGSIWIVACSRGESRRSGRRVGGCSCSCTVLCVTTLLVARVTITKWSLGIAGNNGRKLFLAHNAF